MNRLMMEDKAKREQKEKDDTKKGFISPASSVPEIGSQEYIDNLDIPGAMDDDVALVLYIVAMVVGVIFKDRALVWVGATIIYLGHVFRRKLYKAKWNREHKK